MHSGDIEIAIARHLNPRQNLIVPNVFWGWGISYEVDLVVVTQNKYAWEIEIKTTFSDLKADKSKRHGHHCNRFKRLYFAVPKELKDRALEHIPERAGLFIVNQDLFGHSTSVELVKSPQINMNADKLTDKELGKLYELAAMRLWTLKEVIYRLQERRKTL